MNKVVTENKRIGNWPMWVLGFAVMLDALDQYIIRGDSDQIRSAFHVSDFQIGILFSAFIVVNGVATMPASYVGDRWSRSRIMAITIAVWSILSALGGLVPTGDFLLLLGLRATLGFGQAVSDPAGSSLLADYYGIEKRGRAYSIQQCLLYVGLGLGLGVGAFFGTHFGNLGWRMAFFVSIIPGFLEAYFCMKLIEPRRGSADLAHVTGNEVLETPIQKQPIFPNGVGRFFLDMIDGLKKDVVTIVRIPTMRYALVGVSTILFVVTAVSTWMPTLYQHDFHMSETAANTAFGALVVLAGIPGTIVGGIMADKWVNRFLGARVVIPGICIVISGSLFMASFLPMPFIPSYAIQVFAFLAAAASVPALRAGLSDAVPSHLRGTGFGAFNIASIVFGSALAPIATSALATHFHGNYRVAFLILMPLTLIGSLFLFRARKHIEADTAKIFAAFVKALQESDQTVT